MKWETEKLFDGQLCHEYVYRKLLKLDNPSSSYGKKILCVVYASQCKLAGRKRQQISTKTFINLFHLPHINCKMPIQIKIYQIFTSNLFLHFIWQI